MRCRAYLAGGTTTLIDTQTVPIISDGKEGKDGKDGKVLNIHSGTYTESNLPLIGEVEEADAYLVDNGDGQYDLYYKGSNATNWTVVENWQGVPGESASTYDLICSSAAIIKSESGALVPNVLTFSATKTQGTEAPAAYSGRFVIEESADGST